jgi:transposase
MARPRRIVQLTPEDRATLERYLRSRTAPQRVVQRARIVLGSAAGLSNAEICTQAGATPPTVTLWLDRFEAEGVTALLQDRPRSGRPKLPETPAMEAEIVRRTTQTKPQEDVATHWSTRLLAAELKVSPKLVWRVWKAHGLKPHLVETFKVSNDPHFVEKLHDVVGLYLNPPERAVVFAVDEKSQIQALDRTQPGLPLKKGRAGTMTHDYKRHGTTTLFAALDVATGEIIHDCMDRNRHLEFLRFLRTVEARVKPELEIHIIADNLATHKHARVKAWLAKHPRIHMHFVPTSSSWLNLVERFFGELSQRQLKRLAVNSVDELIAAIDLYIQRRNKNPKPFVWTASVEHILRKGGQSKSYFGVTTLAAAATESGAGTRPVPISLD